MLSVGETAPDFRLADVHGAQESLDHYLATSEGPILLVFFKISCPVCQLTLPFFERLWRSRIQVVGISQDDPSATKKFSAQYGLTFPMLVVEGRTGYAVSSAYRLTHVPTMYMVDKEHSILW